ncbi:MAG: hypothetical protein IKJ74_03455 [Clostridia bacterium]|nr:hypothetical protein [Clostridia bacterium]
MKKLLALLLVLVMLFSFAACGGEEADAPKTEETKTQETQAEEEEYSIPRGEVKDNVYTSAYSGLTLTLPEAAKWRISSDEDLASDMDVSVSFLKDDLYPALSQTSLAYDLKAIDTVSGSTVEISYEFYTKTPEDYLKSVKSKMDSLSGVEYEVDQEGEKVTFGGKEYVSAVYTKESVGTTSTLNYFVRVEEGILHVVLITEFYGFEGDAATMLK